MRIHLTRLTNDRHRLAVVRDDGSTETADLETRSFLPHDLAHYAMEAELGLVGGFWGCVASGAAFSSLAAMTDITTDEMMLAEALAAPLQSLWNGRLPDAAYVTMLEERIPGCDAEALLARMRERLRQTWGRWNATPFGATLELRWPPDS
jgi:hypothetical protein